jgi:hydrogenase maturation protein HypF
MAEAERCQLRVIGTVQGVGFRPFVYRHAVALGLAGFVRNDSAGVLIEVEGPPASVAELGRVLLEQPPPLARVTSVSATPLPAMGTEGRFVIIDSAEEGPPAVPVSVDTATCADCLAEVDDPTDRRYGYPFTNCTNCGPRYTIVISVPYDRPATTMAGFTMCPECRREYEDPADRRFHAQPNACSVCGPQLSWCDPAGNPLAGGPAALDHATAALRSGQIAAIKGIGGFHLAVDATAPVAVAELRRRKARDDKPFAVMVADLDTARRLCHLDAVAEAALTSVRRPVVLVARQAHTAIADGVARGLPELGLFLPYTPLHHLLVRRVARPLVMTSGNLSDDPIAYTDEDVFTRLGPLVDGVLTHNRPIHIRCDDSVLRAIGGTTQLLRRSRGYAPEPMALPGLARRQVLAVGAELKNTITVAKQSWMVASHHIGDLEHLATYQSFRQAIDHLCLLFGVTPEVVAHDLHPEYLSTKLALDLDLPVWGIQHHHAHIASCLAEHAMTEPVLGLAFDGLGYGADGTLWGGEFLVADLGSCRRVGHLWPCPMPGGAAPIREPWRMAVAWVLLSLGTDAAVRHGSQLDPRAPLVADLLKSRTAPLTTSAGRLFDAVAALVGVRSTVSYEGQAAIELEALARTIPAGEAPPYPMEQTWEDGKLVLDPRPLIVSVLEGREKGTPVAQIAASFHEGLARGAVAAAVELARVNNQQTVALSGGVFQNARFSELVNGGLASEGLTVLVHRTVPPNDGGISVGQAAIAATAHHPPQVSA